MKVARRGTHAAPAACCVTLKGIKREVEAPALSKMQVLPFLTNVNRIKFDYFRPIRGHANSTYLFARNSSLSGLSINPKNLPESKF